MVYEQNNYSIGSIFTDLLVIIFQMAKNQFDYDWYQAQPNF